MRIELQEFRNAGRIVIGISGGADSVALTHLLFTSLGPERLLCAHVNHLLRGREAEEDEAFVRKFCEERGVALQVLRADVGAMSREQGIGTEECGRNVRYSYFTEIASHPGDLIVTAHNADDNAETVLLNLARGCGLRGLCGIPPRRGNILRPLLSVTRAEIEAYCRENGLTYRIDSSNLGDAYSRNLVRHRVLPVLGEINPGVVGNTARTTHLLREDLAFLEDKAAEAVGEMRQGCLYHTSKANELHISVLRRAVLQMLRERGCEQLEEKHIDAVIALLSKPGSVCVPPNKLVTVKQNILTVTDVNTASLGRGEIRLGENRLSDGRYIVLKEKSLAPGQKIHKLLFNNCIDYDTIKTVLTAGGREEGDRVRLPGREGTKTLKKLYNERKIPAAHRGNVVVVKDGDSVVFVEGIGPSADYAVSERTERAVEISVLED